MRFRRVVAFASAVSILAAPHSVAGEWSEVAVGSEGENYSGDITTHVAYWRCSSRGATADALANCETAGNWWCTPVGAFRGRCFSTADGCMRHEPDKTNQAYGAGATHDKADLTALDACFTSMVS